MMGRRVDDRQTRRGSGIQPVRFFRSQLRDVGDFQTGSAFPGTGRLVRDLDEDGNDWERFRSCRNRNWNRFLTARARNRGQRGEGAGHVVWPAK